MPSITQATGALNLYRITVRLRSGVRSEASRRRPLPARLCWNGHVEGATVWNRADVRLLPTSEKKSAASSAPLTPFLNCVLLAQARPRERHHHRPPAVRQVAIPVSATPNLFVPAPRRLTPPPTFRAAACVSAYSFPGNGAELWDAGLRAGGRAMGTRKVERYECDDEVVLVEAEMGREMLLLTLQQPGRQQPRLCTTANRILWPICAAATSSVKRALTTTAPRKQDDREPLSVRAANATRGAYAPPSTRARAGTRRRGPQKRHEGGMRARHRLSATGTPCEEQLQYAYHQRPPRLRAHDVDATKSGTSNDIYLSRNPPRGLDATSSFRTRPIASFCALRLLRLDRDLNPNVPCSAQPRNCDGETAGGACIFSTTWICSRRWCAQEGGGTAGVRRSSGHGHASTRGGEFRFGGRGAEIGMGGVS
ncbi:hypothetical protein K438DRAFT_1773688 [Mycena galopus ATCC 62051]|nr:hypothetical protein K438DRAFT_1773688 [Mycena galopus ATCC 62051]